MSKAVPKRRRRLKLLLTLLASMLIACLLLELVVYLVFGTQVRFPRHVVEAPWGIRYNEPNSEYWHTSPDVHVHFAINSQGMRADVDYEYEKAPGTKRIVCLGDSFTIGYEVEEPECFARLIESGLRANGQQAEVLNAGVSGFSNAEALVYLERELLEYDPDVVILSFFVNDLDDNVRSNLFGLKDGALVEHDRNYVPMGRLGNFLNENWLFNFLSEHSNAFALFKEVATNLLKQEIVDQNMANVEAAGGDTTNGEASEASKYQAELCGKILDRLYDVCRQHEIQLIVQSIPYRLGDRLIDAFPLEHFRTDRPGLDYFAAAEVLAPHVGKTLLYWERSHRHWTPFAHELSAERLIELIK